jgi:hypothetical protein
VSTVIVEGVPYSAAIVDRAGRLFVTVARPAVPVGTIVDLDGVAHTVIAVRDPFEPKHTVPPAIGGDFLNDDARRRAESKAISAVEARTAKARGQMGKFCEMELT